MKSFRVQVIGSGYVGLTTALGFSSKGIAVTGVEIDEDKRERINSGRVPFHEPKVGELLIKCLEGGFRVSDSLVDSDVSFITVGTPSRNDGSIDLTYVKSATSLLGEFLKNVYRYHVVVVKSTVVHSVSQERFSLTSHSV